MDFESPNGRSPDDLELVSLEPAPDPARLQRSRSAAPSRRTTALIAMVALVAGAIGGFAGGRATSSNSGSQLAALGANGDGADDTGSPTSTGGSATPSTTVVHTTEVPLIDSAAGTSSFSGHYPQPATTRLFKRTVGDIEIRVSSLTYPSPNCRGQECPPPECATDGTLQVIVIEEWDVLQGGAERWPTPWLPATPTGMLWSNNGGGPTNGPAGVILQTQPDVASVQLLAADGSVLDRMEPELGIAVLVGMVPGTNGQLSGSLEALDSTGTVISTVELTNMFGTENPECRAAWNRRQEESRRPPPLSAPGEQPADRAAAEAAVRDVFEIALGNDDPEAANAVIDDPEGLQAAREASAEQFPQYQGQVQFILDELVFTSPTTAEFSYRVLYDVDQTMLLNPVGSAQLVDGKWLITRATVCTLLPVKPEGVC